MRGLRLKGAWLAAVFVGVSLGTPRGDLPGFTRDFGAAEREAVRLGRDLLVEFTGSDWCVWCERLEAEVLRQSTFQEGLAGRFIAVQLDFPRGAEARARVPDPARQEELKRRYAVGGFPTVLVLEPDGDLVARLGYEAGGPAPFLAALDGALAARDAIAAGAAAFAAAADDTARDAAAEAAVALLERHRSSPRAVDLAPAARRLALAASAASDETEQAQRWRATRALVGAGLVDGDVLAAAQVLDPDNAAGLQELAVRAFVLGVRDARGARAAVEAATRLGRLGAFREPALLADVWANASDWAALVVGDPTRARWFAGLALRAPLVEGAARRRMQERAGG